MKTQQLVVIRGAALLLLLLLATAALVQLLPAEAQAQAEVEAGGGAPDVSAVLELDASNFVEVVKQHPFLVVEFYAPWCGHCKQLAPEYERAAILLEAHDPPIVLAKVNANEQSNRGLAMEHNLTGVPTLKIFQDGGAIVREYKGPNQAEGIVSYLKRQVGPASAEITSAEEGKRLVEGAELLVVGIFPSTYDCEEFKSFSSMARDLQSEYDFKHTQDATFLPEKPSAPVIDGPTIRVFKKFDEGFHDLKEFQVEAVKKLLDDVSIPSVVWFNKDPVQREYLSKIFSERPDDAKAFLFIDAKDAGQRTEEVKAAYGALAKEHKGKGLRFLLADTEDGQSALEHFGASQDKLPSIVIQGAGRSEGKKYILESAEAADIAPWLRDYFDGKAPEFLKSEPVPEKNDGPVKIVVRDTLETLVLQSGKNVLLEFYAPWCGHCKRIAPILEEVAVELQADADIVIAKLDATANDIRDERFAVKGFPTFYLHTAAGKVIPFDGEQTKEGIISFINTNKDTDDQGAAAQEEISHAHDQMTEYTSIKDEL